MNQYLTFSELQDQKREKNPMQYVLSPFSHKLFFQPSGFWPLPVLLMMSSDPMAWLFYLGLAARAEATVHSDLQSRDTKWHWTSSGYVSVQPVAWWSLGGPFHSSTATANGSSFFLFNHSIKASSILSIRNNNQSSKNWGDSNAWDLFYIISRKYGCPLGLSKLCPLVM